MPHQLHRRHVLLQALAAAAAGSPLAALAQTPAAPFSADDLAHAAKLRELGLGTNLAWTLVSSLVKDIGPRPTGSAADAKAVEWAQAQMKRLGLANVRAEPVPLTAWRRPEASAEITAPQARSLTIAALGNSIGDRTLDAEVAYYPDYADLKADTSDRAKGRIVFVDQKTERTKDGSGYGHSVPARYGSAAEAGRRGALAAIVRSIGTSTDLIAHTGGMRYDPAVAPIPALSVSNPDADAIARMQAGGGQPLRMKLRLGPHAMVPVTSHNVIGEVPGTDLANEVVLIGGHLDSWDIAPGAIDDGAGCAISLAAAKVLLDAGRKPRRTVRVVLFANEENGVDGAKAYAERHKDVWHQLVGESDFGADKIWRMQTKVAPAALPAMAAIAEVLRPLGIVSDGNDGDPSPDASVLAHARGWPAIELTQDGTRYFDVHHTVADTLDKIDPNTLPQNVAAWAVVAWLAAQSAQRFG